MISTPNLMQEQTQQAELVAWLQKRLSSNGVMHAIATQKQVLEIARQFKFSNEICRRASLAALLHDCASQVNGADLILYCDDDDVELTPFDRHSSLALHPFVAASLVKRELGLTERDTLDAIRYHATGRSKMGTVEKLVFLAHKIQENTQNPLYRQKIMELINYNNPQSLDIGLLYVFDSSIQFMITKSQPIHPRMIEARNELLMSLNRHHIPYQFRH